MYALLLCMIEKVKHIVKMMGTVNSVPKDEKPFFIEKYNALQQTIKRFKLISSAKVL